MAPTQVSTLNLDLPVAFTGAFGRVGSRVLPFLSKNHTIKGLDLRPGCIDGVDIHEVDLLDLDATLSALRGTRAIVHSAIASYPHNGGTREDGPVRDDYHRRMLDVNIKGTYHVFEAARLLGINQVIYISSLTVVMGHLPGHPDLDEQLPPNPADVYACTKLFGEQMAHLYHRQHGIRVLCLRLGQPYPLGVPEEKEWEKDAYSKAFFLGPANIARAIDCALQANHVEWGIYNILSRNAEGILSHGKAREIGYEPGEC